MRTRFSRILIELGSVFAAVFLIHGIRVQADPPKAAPSNSQLVPHKNQSWDDRAIAGLPPGSRPEVLTWERAYTLALIRYRTPRPAGEQALAKSLDSKVLSEQAARLGIADFARFRTDFLAVRANGESFADPSGSLFDLLRRFQAVENANKFVAALEQSQAAYQEAQATAPNPPRPKQLESWLQKARARLQDELQAYRARLNEVKGELGLSPDTPVVPDRTSLAGFRTVFQKADAWSSNPERRLSELPFLVVQFPRLEKVFLGLLPSEGISEANPNRVAGLLGAAEQVAIKNRGQGGLDKDLRQRIHLRVRNLLKIRTAYGQEKQQWLSGLRARDEAFEQMMTPAPPGAKVEDPDLIALYAQVLESENRLVAQWASFHTERLALARDLRVLPGHDWKSFLAQIPGETPVTRIPDRNPPPTPARPLRRP